ncbi:25S rRNA (adenine645-N1)-methyltransferase [Cytospora paraplurivora]|uniref:Ribosomal RNA-processing protein 8 n=1 Tax=Cytospora paraplurivora TaxID=2898453 RepID=A0AAN9TZZ5_9PEZI
MFAVKGWSVSTEKLKPETASANGSSAAKKSKKRKRSGAAQPEPVTSSNVADLWESVIEQKDTKSQSKKEKSQSKDKKEGEDKEKDGKAGKEKKRQKLSSDHVSSEKTDNEPEAASSKEKGEKQPETPAKEEKSAKKEKKVKKDKSKPKEKDSAPEAKGAATEKKPAEKAVVPVIPAPPKLTPLQAAMREKLISARFRHLNETLYTKPSAEAFQLFEESPEMFTEYHEGFRRQVDVWPENPVDSFLAEIKERGRQRHPSRRPQKPGQQQEGADAKAEVQPLPRNRNTNICTIADLGCGDAGLASGLQADKKKLKLEVLSFDLYSPHPLVTKADIANLPLASGSVDVAIFCLALMGTNWVDFVEEAYRVLRWKGELWVAEIKSRFGSGMKKGGGGAGNVVDHSVGNRRKAGAAAAGKKAAGKQKDAAADEKTLLVEVDGVDDNRQQTDVSAFVDVLNKRGFMLQGQDQGHGAEAVDLSNKMFVKMRFVKSAPATKGKCVRKEEEQPSKLGGKMAQFKKPKFIDDASKDVNEAAVLKPCVYKIR